MKCELIYPSDEYNEKIVDSLRKIGSRITDPRIEDFGTREAGGSRKYEYSWIVKKILEYYDSGKILDLGCGASPLPVFFQESGFSVTAIDTGEFNWMRNIKDPRKALKEAYNTDVNYIIGDILNLSLKKNQFDVVYSVSVFEHIKSDKYLKILLKKIIELLKPGGLFIHTIDYYPLKETRTYFISYSRWVFKRFPIRAAINKIKTIRFRNVDFSIFNINNIDEIADKNSKLNSFGIYSLKKSN